MLREHLIDSVQSLRQRLAGAGADGGQPRLAPLLERHHARIKALAVKNGVRNVRVFGSMARNEGDRKSDIDLLVELQPGKTGLALGGFLVDVSDLTNRKVDVLTENALHPRLRERVLAEAVPL